VHLHGSLPLCHGSCVAVQIGGTSLELSYRTQFFELDSAAPRSEKLRSIPTCIRAQICVLRSAAIENEPQS
jgi:hypothetical protein